MQFLKKLNSPYQNHTLTPPNAIYRSFFIILFSHKKIIQPYKSEGPEILLVLVLLGEGDNIWQHFSLSGLSHRANYFFLPPFQGKKNPLFIFMPPLTFLDIWKWKMLTTSPHFGKFCQFYPALWLLSFFHGIGRIGQRQRVMDIFTYLLFYFAQRLWQ